MSMIPDRLHGRMEGEGMLEDDKNAMDFVDWCKVGDNYYSRTLLYQMSWENERGAGFRDINFEYQRVFLAPYGGPIALCRDESKIVLHLGALSRPDIYVYNSSGHFMGHILWEGGKLIAARWLRNEEFWTVDDRGKVRQFSFCGKNFKCDFLGSLGASCEDEGVKHAVICENGIVARTGAGSFYSYLNFSSVKPIAPAHILSGKGIVHCFEVISPRIEMISTLECVIAIEKELLLIDDGMILHSEVEVEGPIVRLSLSPCGKYLAGFSADGNVYIWLSHLDQEIIHVNIYQTEEDLLDTFNGTTTHCPGGPPDSFVWCGSDAVLAVWFGFGGILVALDGSSKWWDLGKETISFACEVDGVRILNSREHMFFRQVPEKLVKVTEIGSTSPGALLYDAWNLFQQNDSHAAIEMLDIVKSGSMFEAVVDCFYSAAAEINQEKQERLLRSCSYGLAYLGLCKNFEGNLALFFPHVEGKKSLAIVSLAQKLRVINSIKDPKIGIPLTIDEFNSLKGLNLAKILAQRGHYLMAIRVCEVLRLSQEDILLKWASDKIAAMASSSTDEDILKILDAKFPGEWDINWCKLASMAHVLGKRQLASWLVERALSSREKVPLLLSLRETEKAFNVALKSYDNDLILKSIHEIGSNELLKLRNGEHISASVRSKEGQLWHSIRKLSLAKTIIAQYLDMLVNRGSQKLFEFLEDLDSIATYHLENSFKTLKDSDEYSEDKDTVVKELKIAKSCFSSLEKTLGHEDRFEVSAVSAAIRLREIEKSLEKSTGRDGFTGLSVTGVLQKCLQLGLREEATRIAREFKVPQKHQLILSAKDLALKQDWSALLEMVTRLGKRSPSDVESVVRIAGDYNAPKSVICTMIGHISGDNALFRRIQLYSDMGLETEAVALREHAEYNERGSGMLGSFTGLRSALEGSFANAMNRVGRSSDTIGN